VTDWDDAAYGEGFADVYDDWYGDVTDVAGTVAKIVSLAEGRPVLELGIGTGRLALALQAAGLAVSGVDVSIAMVDQLRAKPGGWEIAVTLGDMVDDAPAGPFGVVLAAYNTLFNLPTIDRQRDCFTAVSQRLAPGGFFVVEAAVLDESGLNSPVRMIDNYDFGLQGTDDEANSLVNSCRGNCINARQCAGLRPVGTLFPR